MMPYVDDFIAKADRNVQVDGRTPGDIIRGSGITRAVYQPKYRSGQTVANVLINSVIGTGPAGAIYGYDANSEESAKKEHYTLVQALANQFKEEVGSIICRDILKNPPSDPNPTPRTEQFYKDRPCARMVATAARIMEEFIETHPLEG